jgi:uncharacterized membrane protein
MPGIGGSLFLIALGAIMKWAITVNDTHGFNINTAGVILMVVGVLGLLASLIWMFTRRRTDVIQEGPTGPRRTTVREPQPPAY